MRWLTIPVALWFIACGSKDSGTRPTTGAPTGTGAGTGTGTGTGTGSGTGTGTGGTSATGDNHFTASGTVNGHAIDIVCIAAWYDQVGYGWMRQCQPSTGLHFTQCHSPNDNAHGFDGRANIAVHLNATEVSPGTIDMTTNASGGVTVSGTADIDPPITSASTNVVSNTVVLDTFERDVGASGSFTAEWTDDGGNWANLSGTFRFVCPE